MCKRSWVLGLVPAGLFLVFAGLPQPAAYAADTTPPTGTVLINNNRSATNNPVVTLTLTWDDGTDGSGVSRMRFSDDGAHWTVWEPLAATRAYTLPAGADGHRTVRVQYLDKANNRSVVYSDYILLDTIPPTGGIVIDGGVSTTTPQSVTLSLTWSDGVGSGVSRMRFSDDGAHWSAWETPNASRPYTIPAGLGYHTVRVQYFDGAGNYSAAYNDYIKLIAATEDTVLLPGGVPLVMVKIPGGTFMMGRYPGEQDSSSSEDPQHSVTLGGFWIGKYAVTKRQWTAVMGTTPWSGYSTADPDSPAVFVSWDAAQLFLTAVNSYTGKTFGLPSEAQREYACRAGTTTRFYWGDDPAYTAIGDYAWNYRNAYIPGQSCEHVVGQKLPNAFGLYDMSGNVWELCEDDWHGYTGAPTSGQAWVDSPRGNDRVLRGGSWDGLEGACRSAYRFYRPPYYGHLNFGFRVARTP